VIDVHDVFHGLYDSSRGLLKRDYLARDQRVGNAREIQPEF
jgi:hypothetical protein